MDEAGVLRALLEAYSPSGREGEAVHTFVELASSLGYAASTDGAGNGVARIGSGPPEVMFLGHIDTVEGVLPVRSEGGRIHGRGACDAKGALAAALVAGSRHAGPGEVAVVAAVGEERDSRGARYLLPRHRPDALIVGEPSGWAGVTVGYRGNLSLRIRFEGERRHLSAPEPTTVESALASLEGLRAFCESRRGPTPFRSPSMKVHTIGTEREGSRERVEVGVNLRLPPGLPVREVLEALEDSRLGGDVEVVDRSEAVEVDPRNPVVRGLCAGIRDAGARPTLLRKLGTADLNLAVPAWGCPAAAYGPGDAHLDHTDEERLDLVELRRAVGVLQTAFDRLAAPGRPRAHTIPAVTSE